MDKILHMKCICYSSNCFDIKKFKPIKNLDWIKPEGGLWSSPVNSKWGWKNWCIEQEFNIERLSTSFQFTFKGKAFVINGVKDSSNLPWKPRKGFNEALLQKESFLFSRFIDFELLSKKYDGIFLTGKGEAKTRLIDKYSLYGWDCECLLVLNPKSIYVEKKSLLRSIEV